MDFHRFWEQWEYDVITLLVTLAVTLVVHLVLRKRYRREHEARHVWRDAFIGALNAPLQAALWIIGLTMAYHALTAAVRVPMLVAVFPPARNIATIAVIAWFAIRFVRRATRNLHARALAGGKAFDLTAADAVYKLSFAVVVVLAILFMMRALHFSIASLLTFGGVAGIALGFAAQGLVANLIGGITIYASRPFSVGDHIVFPGTQATGGYAGWDAGEVQHIGWRATRILDWNGKPFYVPNARFNTETVMNHSRMSFRQLSQYVYLRLEDIDKVAGIVADVNRMLEAHPEMGDYLVFRFEGYGEYNLKLYLYAYTASTITAYTDYARVNEDVLLKIAAIIAEHGAKLAVPVASVRLPAHLQSLREPAPEARARDNAGAHDYPPAESGGPA